MNLKVTGWEIKYKRFFWEKEINNQGKTPRLERWERSKICE
jgi:hypothetical protein